MNGREYLCASERLTNNRTTVLSPVTARPAQSDKNQVLNTIGRRNMAENIISDPLRILRKQMSANNRAVKDATIHFRWRPTNSVIITLCFVRFVAGIGAMHSACIV